LRGRTMAQRSLGWMGRPLHLWSGARFGLWVDVETAAAR
jgi:hypothetical protein